MLILFRARRGAFPPRWYDKGVGSFWKNPLLSSRVTPKTTPYARYGLLTWADCKKRWYTFNAGHAPRPYYPAWYLLVIARFTVTEVSTNKAIQSMKSMWNNTREISMRCSLAGMYALTGRLGEAQAALGEF
ncbi:MAG: hypothetical protein U1F68_02085 [Gammaproteobacteria bacterium]